MAVIKTDKDGNRVEYRRNVRTGELEPINENRQIEMDFDNADEVGIEVISEPRAAIINEDGTPALDTQLVLDNKSVSELMITDPEAALEYLLMDQSNLAPAKAGGPSIAFRCDALILACRSNLTSQQNIILDLILGMVSSYPENNVYRVYTKDLKPYLSYKDRSYINKIMSDNFEEIHEKSIDIELSYNGETRTRKIHLVSMIDYLKTSRLKADDKSCYIEFTVEPFTKALMIAAGKIHGSFYSIEHSSQLVGHAKVLFFYLEGQKNNSLFPGGQKGICELSVEQIRFLLSLDENYRTCNILSKIINPSLQKINSLKNIDMQVRCEKQLTGKATTGYRFYITKIEDMKNIASTSELEEKEYKAAIDSKFMVERTILEGSLGLNDKEINDVLKKYERNKRDVPFLTQAVAIVIAKGDTVNPVAYLCKIMDNGLIEKREPGKKKNSFTNISQRNYDVEELERTLLSTNPVKYE